MTSAAQKLEICALQQFVVMSCSIHSCSAWQWSTHWPGLFWKCTGLCHRTGSGNPPWWKHGVCAHKKYLNLWFVKVDYLPVGSDGWRYRSWERPFHMSRFDRGGALLVGSWKLMAFKCNRVQMKMVGISCHGNPKEQRGNEMIIATSVTKDHRECNDAKSTLFGRNDDWLEPIQTMNEIHNKGHGWRKQKTLKQQHWIIGKKSGRRNGDGSKERLRRKTTPVSTGPNSLSCYTKHDRYSSTEPCSCRRKGGLLGLKENAFVS